MLYPTILFLLELFTSSKQSTYKFCQLLGDCYSTELLLNEQQWFTNWNEVNIQFISFFLGNFADAETPRIHRTQAGTKNGRRKQERIHRGTTEGPRGTPEPANGLQQGSLSIRSWKFWKHKTHVNTLSWSIHQSIDHLFSLAFIESLCVCFFYFCYSPLTSRFHCQIILKEYFPYEMLPNFLPTLKLILNFNNK